MAVNSNPRDTPAMRQYDRFKKAHPDCLLVFRIGDFYEIFDEDAVKASKAIGLTLTSRNTIPMCGIPYHSLDVYARKLIYAGFRVAICDQRDEPKVDKSSDQAAPPATTGPEGQGLLFV